MKVIDNLCTKFCSVGNLQLSVWKLQLPSPNMKLTWASHISRVFSRIRYLRGVEFTAGGQAYVGPAWLRERWFEKHSKSNIQHPLWDIRGYKVGKLGVKVVKVVYIAVNGIPSHSYGVSLAIWDHTVLPATRQKWAHPVFTPARQAGTRLT